MAEEIPAYKHQRDRMRKDARREANDVAEALQDVVTNLGFDTPSTVVTRRLLAAAALLHERVAWLAAMDATADLMTAFASDTTRTDR